MPPSPAASSNDELFQHGLHHIVQHNSNVSYPKQERYDEGIHMQSNYGSPGPDDGYGYRGQQQRFPYQHQQQDSGFGMQYEGFNGDYRGSIYRDQYSTPATSPPTPGMNSQELRTRSGMRFPRQQHLRPMPDARSRDTKSPKPKKIKKEKVKAEKKVAKLEKPLSELTKDWTHVPVVDIEAYVNRSAEERRREVDEGKVPGKVKRPMNSFMLYRKAYQNRTKDWCLQNNHQVVSQVCGDSWPLEPDEVKDQFSEWARLERLNHQNAHPGYKFSPSKPGAAKAATKRKFSQDIVSDESELSDFEWKDPSFRKHPKKNRYHPAAAKYEHQQPVEYPTQRSAYVYSRDNSIEPNLGGPHRSSYQVNNPGQPLPAQYNQSGLRDGEYYQQTISTNPRFPGGAQDVLIRKTATPNMQPQFQLGVAVPGGVQEFNSMDPFQYGQETGQQNHKIDPSLMQHHMMYENGNYNDDHLHQEIYYEQPGAQHWQPQYSAPQHDPPMPFVDPELHHEDPQIHDPHVHVLKGQQEGWHVETLDGGGEFDKWMGEEERGPSPA